MTNEVDANVEVQEITDEKLKAIRADFLKTLMTQTENLEEVKMDDISLGPWSYSKLRVLEKCPLQFYLSYILKAKLPKELLGEQDKSQTHTGSASHRILELVMQGKTVSEAYVLAKTEFVPELLTEEQWVSNVESVEYQITAFHDRMDNFKRRHKIRKIYTELRLGITRDWRPTKFFASDVFIRGVVDLVILLENGDCIVIDHKHGQPFSSGIRHNKQQLDSYLPLINFGLTPIKGATAGIHFVKDGQVIMDDFKTKDEIEGKLKTMVEFNIEGAIESTKEAGLFEHRVGSQCQWCDYKELCKAKKASGNLKPIEEKTKKFFKIQAV